MDSENTHSFHDVSPFLLANVKSNFSEPALLLGALIGKNGACDREGNCGEQFVSEVGEGIADTRGEAEIGVIVSRDQVTHKYIAPFICAYTDNGEWADVHRTKDFLESPPFVRPVWTYFTETYRSRKKHSSK